jgi:hypothetical protein
MNKRYLQLFKNILMYSIKTRRWRDSLESYRKKFNAFKFYSVERKLQSYHLHHHHHHHDVVLGQVHSIFKSEFSKACDLEPSSIATVFSFP